MSCDVPFDDDGNHRCAHREMDEKGIQLSGKLAFVTRDIDDSM
jgi:hypothetical protein